MSPVWRISESKETKFPRLESLMARQAAKVIDATGLQELLGKNHLNVAE
jgi:hypothetical protein